MILSKPSRRLFLSTLGIALAAPAIVRATSIMPVKSMLILPSTDRMDDDSEEGVWWYATHDINTDAEIEKRAASARLIIPQWSQELEDELALTDNDPVDVAYENAPNIIIERYHGPWRDGLGNPLANLHLRIP